jgi:enterochelin esterase-like enzyme
MTAKTTAPVTAAVITRRLTVYSAYLEREVHVDLYYPGGNFPQGSISLLLVNDGQDLAKMGVAGLLEQLYAANRLQPLLVAGIHCGENRLQEYGTACTADFEGRGNKAGLYSKFVLDELLPCIRKNFSQPSFKEKAFAGFSLGALTALDIAWNHATEFAKVGVFSGSLWWRRKAYGAGYTDENDRIMHLQVRKGIFYPWLQFFFQCGTHDETADRNNNGVIDSIDDTLDMIVELKAKGYTDAHIRYLLVEGGKHDIDTWAKVLPVFLEWGWGK